MTEASFLLPNPIPKQINKQSPVGLVPWAKGRESGSHPQGPHPTCRALGLHPYGPRWAGTRLRTSRALLARRGFFPRVEGK